MRAFLSGFALSVPLWAVAVGWGLDNGPLMIVGVFGFLVGLWGLEVGVPTWRYRKFVQDVNAPAAVRAPRGRSIGGNR